MCVTAYGLCNSQPTYQRIMDEALVDLKQVDSFVDNVCQYSSTLDEMMERLREIFGSKSQTFRGGLRNINLVIMKPIL